MRLKFSIILIFFFSLLTLFVGCQKTPDSLVLIQNKPEIDAALQAYGKVWSEKTGVNITLKSVGGSSSISMGQQLKADYAAGEMPDIFIIAGIEDYLEWESLIADLSDEPWTKNTSVAFTNNGKVYGFPVAIEGYGMAYNEDLLERAGIDPSTLNNFANYQEAFALLDSMKDELGIDSVVSMAASLEMGWVTAHHNFNALLSNGLDYNDKSVGEALLAGQVDQERLSQYADWVELLFTYANPSILRTGNYDSQVGAFASQKSVFIHQGNWIDPNLADANATFTMGYAPYGSLKTVTDGIFVAAPSFYVINSESKNIEEAKQFLRDLAESPEGADFTVNQAGMIPAFSTISARPKGALSTSVQEWNAQDKVYAWNQYLFSGDFRDNTLAPIYNQFATENISKEEFIQLLTDAFENRKS